MFVDDGDTDDDDDKWLSKLQACKWLKLVSKTLHGAASLARLLNYTNIQFVGMIFFSNFSSHIVL